MRIALIRACKNHQMYVLHYLNFLLTSPSFSNYHRTTEKILQNFNLFSPQKTLYDIFK